MSAGRLKPDLKRQAGNLKKWTNYQQELEQKLHILKNCVSLHSLKHEYFMIFKRLSPLLLIFISLSVAAQISLKTPRICHDKDGYLTSFFEGSYQMQFNKGNFRCLTSVDSDFVYNDSDKTITYYR